MDRAVVSAVQHVCAYSAMRGLSEAEVLPKKKAVVAAFFELLSARVSAASELPTIAR